MARGPVNISIDDKKFRARLNLIARNQEREIDNTMKIAAEVIRTRAVKGIQSGPASGAPRADGSRASAPGEFPMTDTGSLVSSVFTSIRKSGRRVIAFVGSDIVYAKFLEFGTRRMAARPWLQPSFDEVEDQVRAIIRAGFQKANRKR